MGVTASAAVDGLSAALRVDFVLVGPLAGGETGATEVRRPDGRRHVLKWELDPQNQRRRREGAQLAERLRVDASWPSPQQEVVEVDGCLFVLQEFMPGADIEHLSHELVDRLFDLHDGASVLHRTTPGTSGPKT